MGAFDDADLTGRTGGRRTSRPRSAPLAAALLVFLTLFCLFAAVAPAGAVTAPGRPTAKTPKGAINTTRPTFKWSKAARAAKYEVRVYKGRTLKLKKTGITRLSWKFSKTLPRGVSLTWKVRGRNAGGNGAWSKRLTFKVRAATKAITAFSFQGLSPPVTGIVTEAAHTIALTVPFGTNVSALVATFSTTGASVAVGGTPQVSGTTANNFSSQVTYRVTAANASTQDYMVTVVVAANPAKAITAFSFQGLSPPVTGIVTEAARTIALTVPFGTNGSALVATFTTTGASVAVGGAPQVSGTTANNFSSQVTYRVTAANASTQDYTVTVTVAANPAKAITAFTVPGQTGATVINETLHTIAVTVPFGTNVSALVPAITITGASVSPASGVATNFSSAVTYTVTAADATTQPYAVTVTAALNPAKAITAFSFASPAVTGTIDETSHTIALTVPTDTLDSSPLVATFTSTGASVAMGASPQTSGTTANDFSDPVTYTVTAADGTKQAYLVTVYRIGKSYGGGKIAYILQPTDPGYVAGQTHGLIAAVSDQSTAAAWWNGTALATGATGTALGSGEANTATILAVQGTGLDYAASLAHAYTGGGHSDWYLPSKDELNELFVNRAAIGGFDLTPGGSPWWAGPYWSSSEYDNAGAPSTDFAWAQYFSGGVSNSPAGVQHVDYKNGADYRVRAVRSF